MSSTSLKCDPIFLFGHSSFEMILADLFLLRYKNFTMNLADLFLGCENLKKYSRISILKFLS